MKLQSKILTMVAIPIICLALCSFFIAANQLETNVTNQAYSGMEATALAVNDLLQLTGDGDFHIDGNNELWIGDELNVTGSRSIVDNIKARSGYDVSIYYGDTCYLTTFVDENGDRMFWTQAEEKVVNQVLNEGETYYNDNTVVMGTRYICCYIPIYEGYSANPAGMIFLGQEYSKVSELVTESIFELLVPVAVVFVLSLIIASVVGVRIVKGIQRGISYVNQLSDGELKLDMDKKLLKKKDAVGEMCRSIQNLSKKLTDVLSKIQGQCNILNTTSRDCTQVAGKVLNSMEQITAAVEEIAATTTTQAEETGEAGDKITLMGEMVHDTTVEVKEMSEAAGEMETASDTAKGALTELEYSMERVTEAVDRISVQTGNTHESVQQISEVTNVISEIAAQTDLLSLNASIEAARAGELGKGFAVVASEIQKLAVQSNKSAEEIQVLLEKLLDNSQNSMSAMSEVNTIIHEQGGKIAEANRLFGVLELGIDKSAKGIQAIQGKAATMDNARKETIEIVRNVSDLAQENVASTQETSASVMTIMELVDGLEKQAKDLKDISNVLDENVHVFKI